MLVFGRVNAIATFLIIIITLLNIIVYKLRQIQEANFGEKVNIWLSLSAKQKCRRFSLAEIQLATNHFDDALVIGQGGFGKVYKGLIDNGASTIAIKRWNFMSKQGALEFWTEIETLSKFQHSHVVSLIGYCNNDHDMIIVYEYMIHGTIAAHLHKINRTGNSLSWVQRLKICIGAVRGLDYLHTGTGVKDRVIHRDVKSSNILLDENWAAKISDFGMSKIGPANQSCTHVSTNVKGTCDYLDPSYYLTHRVTRKSDVYAFGVVLFETLCARPALDVTLVEEQRVLAKWAQHCMERGILDQIIDPSLRGKILPNCLTTFAEIADQCLLELPKKRPTMTEVVARLEFGLIIQERRDSSIIESDIYNIGGAYDNQENVDSSTIQLKAINVGNGGSHGELNDGIIRLGDTSDKQSRTKPSTMTFATKLRLFFLGINRVISDKKVILESAKRNKQRTEKPSQTPSSVPSDANNNSSDKIVLWNEGGSVLQKVNSSVEIVIPSLKRFNFNELKRATRNFRPDMELGLGEFGQVSKCWVDEQTYSPAPFDIGMAVAVKKFDVIDGRKQQVKATVEFLGNFSHPNLVKLLGYCLEDKHFLLVYEYMQNGSLDSYLFTEYEKPFPWFTRLQIAIGVARALVFFHTREKKIICGDIKASHILLDGDFNPKLWYYGIPNFGPTKSKSHISTSLMSTNGYAAPE